MNRHLDGGYERLNRSYPPFLSLDPRKTKRAGPGALQGTRPERHPDMREGAHAQAKCLRKAQRDKRNIGQDKGERDERHRHQRPVR